MKQHLRITGMHCANCTGKVGKALRGIGGVSSAEVKLPNMGIVTTAKELPLAAFQEAIRTVGSYEIAFGRPTLYETLRPFAPLAVMFGIVAVWALVVSYLFPSPHAVHDLMRNFMGGFFLLFGALKVLNLKVFAQMYSGYDVLARRVPAWGYIYPFVEIELGILYTLDLFAVQANIATALLMSIGTIGIVQKLRSGAQVQCACLGSVFTVPLTWVTVAENLLMVLMALYMLFLH